MFRALSRVQTLRLALQQPSTAEVGLFHREVSAIVVDLGLPTCKASYVGEDAPKAVFPSVVGAVAVDVDVDSSKTNSNSEDPKSEKGRVNASSTSCLIIDPKEHPMLLAEPPLNTQQAVDYSAFSPGYTMPDYMECWSQIEYRKEAMKSKTSCDRACLLFNAGSEETVLWWWELSKNKKKIEGEGVKERRQRHRGRTGWRGRWKRNLAMVVEMEPSKKMREVAALEDRT
ncbi:hypothetical protein Bca52824_046520 [Brassica carinata]|uniref:Uncharacterized protein n=1 Tax=Brassica carinata TaxID=52824 RepID=A0A8X7REK2_BRACI|nr:hypothetical protein Bca52824_046520 [Brassica carinata]